MDSRSSASHPESYRSQTRPEKPRRPESTSSAGSQSRFSITSTPPAQNRENPDPLRATPKARGTLEPQPIATGMPEDRKSRSARRVRDAGERKLGASSEHKSEKFHGIYPALLRGPKPSRERPRTAQ